MNHNSLFPELNGAEHESPFLNDQNWEQNRHFLEPTFQAESKSPFLMEINIEPEDWQEARFLDEGGWGTEYISSLTSTPGNFNILDLRTQAKPRTAAEAAARGGVNTVSRSNPSRTIQEIDAVVLHHMAFDRGNNVQDYLKVVSHYIILRDGTIGQLWDHKVVLNAANGFNNRGISIEFAGNFPSDSGKWWYSSEWGPITRSKNELRPTTQQISAGRFLLQHLKANLPNLNYVFAHRQSSDSRTNDPGPDIWYGVGEWAINQAGYSPLSRDYFIKGKGKSIPDSWRRWNVFQQQVQFHNSGQQAQPQFQSPGVGTQISWSNAVQQNRYWSQKLDWDPHRYAINDLLLPLMGLSNLSLNEEDFAQGVAFWQRNNGFTGKDVDGIIGPNTWKKLQKALFNTRETTDYDEQEAETAYYDLHDTSYSADEAEYDNYELLHEEWETFDEDELPDDGLAEEHFSQHELEEMFLNLEKLTSWWKAQQSPTVATTSNYWQEFKKRAACIAEREWAAWDNGKRHESDPLSWGALVKYFSVVKSSQAEAEESANSNKKKNGKGEAWSAAFISYLMRAAGAGASFKYSPSHYGYMVAAKKNRTNQTNNPFQLFDLNETGALPEVGDLICNYRGCFEMTYNNIENAGSSSCTTDGKKTGWHAHCDLIVKVEKDKVWVIGGNTSDSVSGNDSTVGRKSRRLDANGYLVREKRIFAILKVRTDINAAAPVNPTIESCSGSGSDSPTYSVSAISTPSASWNESIEENRKWGAKLGWQDRIYEINDLLLPMVGMQNVSLDEATFAEAVSIWQRNNGFYGKDIDGIIGPKTWAKMEKQLGAVAMPTSTNSFGSAVLAGATAALASGSAPPVNASSFRKFRLTTYHVVNQKDFPTGSTVVAFLDKKGNKIAEGSPAFFAKAALEGTGKLLDGRLINVAGAYTPASHADYQAVLDYHNVAYKSRNQKNLAVGDPPVSFGYSGLVVSGNVITQVKAFHIVSPSNVGAGYGIIRDIPLVPFRTLAADIGNMRRHDSNFKGKGGLVPPGTKVYIKEYDGLQLPDKTIHDGWFTVNDTGGAIFGVHFDVFVGSEALRKQVKLPEFGQVWFNGIELRIPANYTYGLNK